MGVLEIPTDETALRQEVETFIDENGRIDMQAMKDKGYMEDQIYDIMNAYFIATARVLAAYRRDRKAQDTMLKMLQDKIQLHEEKIICADKYMSYLCDVKSTQKINNNLYTKVEENMSRCSDKKDVHDGNITDEEKNIRHSPSAPDLSPSKYFNSFSVEPTVRETKSSHNIFPETIANTIPNEKEESIEIDRRIPTPYPSARNYDRFPQPNRNSSYTTELVTKQDTTRRRKQIQQCRKTNTPCSHNTGQLKKVINQYEDILGLSTNLKTDGVSDEIDFVEDRSEDTLSNGDVTLESVCVDDRSEDIVTIDADTLERGHLDDRSKDTLPNNNITLESAGLATPGITISITSDASSSVSSCCQDYVQVNVDEIIKLSTHTSRNEADSRTSFQTVSQSHVDRQSNQSQTTIVSKSSCLSSAVASLKSSSVSVQVTSNSSKTHSQSTVNFQSSQSQTTTVTKSTVDSQSNQSQTATQSGSPCFSNMVTRLKSSSMCYTSAPSMFTADKSLQRSFSSESHKMSHFSIECVRIHQSMPGDKSSQSDVSIYCANNELPTNSQGDISQTSNVESSASENSDEFSDSMV
ncbi:serine-rich adhesin for platelets-like [Mytilus edulis]|uniref:serine-rich adhesin for platelets-like n=1 Tax=Mytilus edulis TaxID=6550 RepID=UPI0039EFC19A